MNGDKLLHDAFLIALEAHQGQKRKTEDAPYIVHPVMVAQNLAEYGFNKEVVAAGLVHDVLEDTDFPETELENRLGAKVVETVKTVSHLGHRSWEESREEYLKQVAQGSPAAKAVCCADKINNAESIIEAHAIMGEAVWQKFSRGQEKQLWFYRSVLEMLKASWDNPMFAEYEKLVTEMENLPKS
ncbi:MAG: HD domain-containing protein [Candidatus Pacebacteria bacterium]|nr:HD domain-containing protein [Candidatus Paceibacterota bacterium]